LDLRLRLLASFEYGYLSVYIMLIVSGDAVEANGTITRLDLFNVHRILLFRLQPVIIHLSVFMMQFAATYNLRSGYRYKTFENGEHFAVSRIIWNLVSSVTR
jgi:hypothetical protein